MSLTRNEAVTLIVLSVLFVGGLLARHVQQQVNPIAPDAYAEADREFFERSARHQDDASAVKRSETGNHAIDSLAANPGPAGGTDSTGGAVLERATSEVAEALSRRRIDLNHASLTELQQLPRIGPKTAERIVNFRETYGPFGHIEDLVQVRGIGPKTMDGLRPLIHVRQDSLPR